MSYKHSVRPGLAIIILVLFSTLILACGGGGGGGGVIPPSGGGGTSLGDGTMSSPILIQTEKTYSGNISSINYYYFQSGTAGKYQISITGNSEDLSWALHNSSGFDSLHDTPCDIMGRGSAETCIITLDADTPYYLLVYNWSFFNDSQFNLIIHALAPGEEAGVLVQMAVDPDTPTAYIGSTLQLYAKGTYGDGSVANVTSGVSWSSDDTSCATVSASGVVTGVKSCDTYINASVAGFKDRTRVYVESQGTSNGTASSPVAKDINLDLRGSIGVMSRDTSYYSFVTNTAGYYYISIYSRDTHLRWDVYDTMFTGTPVKTCGDDPYGFGTERCWVLLAQANTTYYLKVTNLYDNAVGFDLSITEINDEGAPGAPRPLELDQTTDCMVSGNSSSYYSFILNSTGSAQFSTYNTDSTLLVEFFDSDQYTGSPLGSGSTTATASNLNAGPVYVKVTDTGGNPAVFTATPTGSLSEGSTTDPVPLTVGVTHTGSGVDAYGGASYYAFTTPPDGGTVYYAELSGYNWSASLDLFTDFSSPSIIYCYGEPCTLQGLESSTTYYLRVSNGNTWTMSYDISIVAGQSEGTPGSPVSITPEVEHKLNMDVDASNYYTFTPLVDGMHHVAINNGVSYLDWLLYSDSGFSSEIASCSTGTVRTWMSCPTPALTAGTPYYLKLVNPYPGDTGEKSLLVTSVSFSEGTLGNPKPLELNTAYDTGVDAMGVSYYSFDSNGLDGTYTVSITNRTSALNISVYDNPDFATGLLDSCNTVNCSLGTLVGVATYYVKLTSSKAYDNDIVLTVQAPTIEGCVAGAAECFEMEDGLFPSAFTNDSTASTYVWVADPYAPANGSYSLGSDAVDNQKAACFEYAPAYSTTTVTFNFKVASEADGDYLSFYRDSNLIDQWSGSVNWTHWNSVAASGMHTYAWCYEKNNSQIGGLDAAWVDDISFYEETISALYDFDDGLVPATFVNSGVTDWSNDAGSLVSGAVAYSESSCIEVSETVSAGVFFDLEVDSDPDTELRFYVDGVMQDSWSGLGVSQAPRYDLSAGTYTFKWCYYKGWPAAAGADAAWIDNLIFY